VAVDGTSTTIGTATATDEGTPLGFSILAYLLQPKYKMTLEVQEAQD
jgi:hypothetical protein